MNEELFDVVFDASHYDSTSENVSEHIDLRSIQIAEEGGILGTVRHYPDGTRRESVSDAHPPPKHKKAGPKAGCSAQPFPIQGSSPESSQRPPTCRRWFPINGRLLWAADDAVAMFNESAIS